MTLSERLGVTVPPERPPVFVTVPDFTREDMVDLFRDLGFTAGAEIGVGCGRFSEQFCTKMPHLRMLSIDPYRVFGSYHQTQEPYDAEFAAVSQRLGVFPHCTLIRKTSMEAVVDVPDRSLDFVYIDGDHHYSYALDDIRAWSAKVRVGGIVAGHDFNRYAGETGRHWNVKQAVHDFANGVPLAAVFIFGRHARRRGYRKCPRSYMWVNPGE